MSMEISLWIFPSTMRSGPDFKKAVFIIKKENEETFRAAIGDRIASHIETAYVFQDLNNIPEGIFGAGGQGKALGRQAMPS